MPASGDAVVDAGCRALLALALRLLGRRRRGTALDALRTRGAREEIGFERAVSD